MKLALTLPWSSAVPNATIQPGYAPNPAFNPSSTTLSTAVTALGEVALYVGFFLMFFWAAWGVFDYIKAEGNKEGLAKARKKIQWAIIGFIILIMSFLMSDFLQTVLIPGVDLGGTGIVDNATFP